jgi:L-alanine-DL-glutamate epimerase-like enolase superfamily enzyme
MKITAIESRNIRIPLNNPKSYSTKKISFRDYTVVKIRTEDGVEGWSYVWGVPVVNQVIEMLKNLVIGETAASTTYIWYKLFSSMKGWDRSGFAMRGISAIDIALWDIIGKYAKLPIYRLMGTFRTECPAYYSAGYYPESCKSKQEQFTYLEKEMGKARESGFQAFKMKIGAHSVDEDVERIGVVRGIIGEKALLMLDANCAYDPETIIPMARKFEKYDITWIEEPVEVDDLDNCAYVAQRISMPIAVGESHFTRWQIREILEHNCCRYIQTDPTVTGGFTEYVNIAGLAAAYGIKLSPHCFHDINIQIALARPEIYMLEYMDASSDIFNIQAILKNPVLAKNGMLQAPEEPGHGLLLDEKALQRYLL